MAADLHVHSTYSDGSLTPEELVKLAVKNKLSTIAIADHDTVDGINIASRVAGNYELEVIPAIEFSTFRKKAEIHILGYYIDYGDPRLLNKVKEIFTARIKRARKMVKLLNQQGVEITFQQVKKIAGDDYIGRPHIARALVDAGYVKEMGEAFCEKYIGNNAQAYVPKCKLSPEKVIKLISNVGGIPVLAHPFFINHGQPMKREQIAELVESGLKGLEVFHSKHDFETSQYYQTIAEELNLLITGGSDFHGENSPGVKMGDITIKDDYVRKLKEFHTC